MKPIKWIVLGALLAITAGCPDNNGGTGGGGNSTGGGRGGGTGGTSGTSGGLGGGSGGGLGGGSGGGTGGGSADAGTDFVGFVIDLVQNRTTPDGLPTTSEDKNFVDGSDADSFNVLFP